jgi:hypothetical protein
MAGSTVVSVHSFTAEMASGHIQLLASTQIMAFCRQMLSVSFAPCAPWGPTGPMGPSQDIITIPVMTNNEKSFRLSFIYFQVIL